VPRGPSAPHPPSRAPGHLAGGQAESARAVTHPPIESEADPLDAFSRHHASLAPPDAPFGQMLAVAAQPLPIVAASAPAEAPALRAAAGSLEELLPALVRRVAWSGDGRRGTVRLELGAGELAGATLLVHADSGRVRVRLDVPPGVDAARWERRIRQRLEANRIPAEVVEVA
jgi:hypothetical protein